MIIFGWFCIAIIILLSLWFMTMLLVMGPRAMFEKSGGYFWIRED